MRDAIVRRLLRRADLSTDSERFAAFSAKWRDEALTEDPGERPATLDGTAVLRNLVAPELTDTERDVLDFALLIETVLKKQYLVDERAKLTHFS